MRDLWRKELTSEDDEGLRRNRMRRVESLNAKTWFREHLPKEAPV